MAATLQAPKWLKIICWSHDELYVHVEYPDRSWHTVPVDTADDGDVLWVLGQRYSAETGERKPKR